jgi:hypothetical protein
MLGDDSGERNTLEDQAPRLQQRLLGRNSVLTLLSSITAGPFIGAVVSELLCNSCDLI